MGRAQACSTTGSGGSGGRRSTRRMGRAGRAGAAVIAACTMSFVVAPVAAHAAVPTVPIDLETATVAQLDTLLDTGQTTSVALTQAYLQRIEQYSQFGPRLDAIRSLNPQAIKEAKAADRELKAGQRGALLGIPVLLKDNIDLKGLPTTAGSVALANSYPRQDAPITASLKAAGAVILGKANLTEFANYLTSGMPAGYSSLGGQVLNAYDLAATPSGSSAGPAVAASIGLAPLTVGTETSGSILSPANADSDVGIKPTVGLVSRTGIVPISHTQDTAGPLTKTVADAAALLTALVTSDPAEDPATAGDPLVGHDFTGDLNPNALQGVRLGLVTTKTCTDAACDTFNVSTQEPSATSPVKPLYDSALAALQRQGAVLVPVTITIPFIPNPGAPAVLSYDFKHDLDSYLAGLPKTDPVHSLQDVIDYNDAHAVDEDAIRYGQTLALASEAVNLSDPATIQVYDENRARDIAQSKTAIDQAMAANGVSALIYAGAGSAGIGAKAGYPSISVPSGYYAPPAGQTGVLNFNLSFLGQAYTEPQLIGYAYDYEQATQLRRPPTSLDPALTIASPTPALPEAPIAVAAPLAAIALLGGSIAVRRRRQVHAGS